MFETIFVLGLVLTGIVCVVACSDKLVVQQVLKMLYGGLNFVFKHIISPPFW